MNAIVIQDKKLNARQAAQVFVEAHFPDRTIGKWEKACFRLLDGCRWWEVKLHKDGWEISPLESVKI